MTAVTRLESERFELEKEKFNILSQADKSREVVILRLMRTDHQPKRYNNNFLWRAR
jgi:hypothetical protein